MTDQLQHLRETFGFAGAIKPAEKKYDPDQPRVPKGEPIGGEWTDDSRSSGEGGSRDAASGSDFRSFASEDEMFKWGERHFKGWIGKLTDDEKAAIDYYVSKGFIEINKTLRRKRSMTEDQLKETLIPDLDAALERASVPEDLLVYRGVVKKVADMMQPGAVFQDKGYMSTTVRADATDAFGDDAQINIRVPKGTNGAYVDGLAWDPSEHEVLLPRNTKLKIHKKYRQGTKWIIEASVEE